MATLELHASYPRVAQSNVQATAVQLVDLSHRQGQEVNQLVSVNVTPSSVALSSSAVNRVSLCILFNAHH